MTDTDIKVVQIIAEYLGLSPEDVDRHALLGEELNLGPIELHDLLTELSQKFNVTFDDVDIEDLKKVDDLIVLVEDNLLD